MLDVIMLKRVTVYILPAYTSNILLVSITANHGLNVFKIQGKKSLDAKFQI